MRERGLVFHCIGRERKSGNLEREGLMGFCILRSVYGHEHRGNGEEAEHIANKAVCPFPGSEKDLIITYFKIKIIFRQKIVWLFFIL